MNKSFRIVRVGGANKQETLVKWGGEEKSSEELFKLYGPCFLTIFKVYYAGEPICIYHTTEKVAVTGMSTSTLYFHQ